MSMNDTLGFFIPVSFGNNPAKTLHQTLLERVDDYFYLGGRVAVYVITTSAREQVDLADVNPSFSNQLVIALKIASYFTIVLPLIMLIAKTILRSQHTFYIVPSRDSLPEDSLPPKCPITQEKSLPPMCPITQAYPRYPVRTECGHIFERVHLEQWIETKGRGKETPCPSCRQPVGSPTDAPDVQAQIQAALSAGKIRPEEMGSD